MGTVASVKVRLRSQLNDINVSFLEIALSLHEWFAQVLPLKLH
jgi:hypothetical protein